MTRLSKHKEEM